MRWVKSKAQIDETKWKEGLTWFDGLGRTIRSQSVDDDGDVSVLTCYDNMGRVSKATNPFRNYSTQDCTTTTGLDWTTNTYDTAGRPWKTNTPDGAVVETTYGLAATTGYTLGTVVTVEDQADKQRRSITNALGQLIRVDEPDNSSTTGSLGSLTSPNQPTTYAYDTLNNLTTVTQGVQTRSFAYDALTRLKEATNPESGTIKYTYDANGNLKTKWDARGIKAIYDYDAFNRVWKRCYKSVGTSSLGYTTCATASGETAESNTPDVTYYYDNLTNAKGKLTKVSSSVSTTEYTSFDIVGRVTGHKQTTDGNDYTTAYAYNLSGGLIEQTYPSGRKVQNTLDASGDLEMVSSRKNANSGYWAYANNFSYSASGAVASMQLGNGTWESTLFNSRLQPTQISLGVTQNATGLLKLDYSYGTTTNNGNVLTQTITVPGLTYPFVQTYAYDSLNRLDDANETYNGGQTWRQDFTYDRYGNRNLNEPNTSMEGFLKECSGNTVLCPALRKKLNPSINSSDNRPSTSDDYSFDSAGNTTGDPDSRTFIYDAENKQIHVKNSSNATIGQYSYDGDRKRVKKYVPPVGANPGETTIFVYDAVGKLVAEYSTVLASTQDAKVAYLTNDHLGSPRINTDRDGTVTARHDYRPFGEEITTSQRTAGLNYADDTVRKQFTGYERDGETALDFAQARYFVSNHGRFSSPDSMAGEKLNPQSMNRFSYVLNNPLKFTDPTGNTWEWPSQGNRGDGSGWHNFSVDEFRSKYPRFREWVNDKGRPLWVPPDEYAAKQTDRSKLPLWIEMSYPSAEGRVDLDSRGPNPDNPWGWTLDRIPVGEQGQPALSPSPPGENRAGGMGLGFAPILFADEVYSDSRALRSRAQALFPDSRGLDGERHRWATRQTSLKWGTATARTLGVLNEIQGFILWDLGPLVGDAARAYPSGAFISTRGNWAFQWSDLMHNERGIAEANSMINRVPK